VITPALVEIRERFSPQPLEEATPAPALTPDLWSPRLFLLSQVTKFVVISYSSHRNLNTINNLETVYAKNIILYNLWK
jgi:hypothetical protein